MICFAFGYAVGAERGRKTDAKPPVAGVQPPASSQAERDAAWKYLNSAQPTDPDGSEAMVAAILGMVLDPTADAELRDQGLMMYGWKSALYFQPEEIDGMKAALDQGPPDKRLETLRRINEADLKAALLARDLLADPRIIEYMNRKAAAAPTPDRSDQ